MAGDLAVLDRRRLCLGPRIVAHALAHRGQDLVGVAPCRRDEKDMTKASFVSAVLLGQPNKHLVIRGSNAALLELGGGRRGATTLTDSWMPHQSLRPVARVELRPRSSGCDEQGVEIRVRSSLRHHPRPPV